MPTMPATVPLPASTPARVMPHHESPLDLRPLVDHIAALEGQVQQLTEAATVWQVRAMQAEERLKQLTAGPVADAGHDAPQRPQDAPGDERAGDVATDAPAPWWRRWWRSVREGYP